MFNYFPINQFQVEQFLESSSLQYRFDAFINVTDTKKKRAAVRVVFTLCGDGGCKRFLLLSPLFAAKPYRRLVVVAHNFILPPRRLVCFGVKRKLGHSCSYVPRRTYFNWCFGWFWFGSVRWDKKQKGSINDRFTLLQRNQIGCNIIILFCLPDCQAEREIRGLVGGWVYWSMGNNEKSINRYIYLHEACPLKNDTTLSPLISVSLTACLASPDWLGE